VHDLSPAQAARLLPPQSDTLVWFPAAPAVKPCVGCFHCWIKTPGECVIPDRGQQFCHLLARADRFTVVSRCYYGGFSPDVKAVVDRHIAYMLPFFHAYEGEMHHIPRYEQRFALAWHLYGDITQAERETALRYAAANARNMHAAGNTVAFYASEEELEVAA
ncbi:MAG: flavodoxin family protein, partial [Firmicutes bacterium]|nr:flavodoxin family protein [Bacillota bacterium]